jgi:hypothetical protein
VEPETLAPLEERAEMAVAVAEAKQGYVSEDGQYQSSKVADRIYPLVKAAVAHKTAERASVGLTQRDLMKAAYPDVAGPEDWAEQDDPDLAEAVYLKLNSKVWRMTSDSPTGPLQSRLNSEAGLVLCRTRVNPNRTQAVYVTRDRECIKKDIIEPHQEAQKRRAKIEARLAVMLIDRIPDHARYWDSGIVGGLSESAKLAKTEIAGALADALTRGDDDQGE